MDEQAPSQASVIGLSNTEGSSGRNSGNASAAVSGRWLDLPPCAALSMSINVTAGVESGGQIGGACTPRQWSSEPVISKAVRSPGGSPPRFSCPGAPMPLSPSPRRSFLSPGGIPDPVPLSPPSAREWSALQDSLRFTPAAFHPWPLVPTVCLPFAAKSPTGQSGTAGDCADGRASKQLVRRLTVDLAPCFHACNSRFSFQPPPTLRRLLTKDSQPAAPGSVDNAERYLIIRVGDLLSGPLLSQGGAQPAGHDPRLDGDAVGGPVHKDAEFAPAFEVVDNLGYGCFGQVVLCRLVGEGPPTTSAVKVIKSDSAYTAQAGKEAAVLSVLSRDACVSLPRTGAPGITSAQGSEAVGGGDGENGACRALTCGPCRMVKLDSCFTHQGHVCLAFEVLGCSLLDALRQGRFRGFDIASIKPLALQLLSALETLSTHRLIHCDLKPENVLFQRVAAPASLAPGADCRIKLIDFGSACYEDAPSVTSYIQSRHYRAPEVLLGLPYDCSVDMWSLGCILLELLVGLPPFPGASHLDQLRHIIALTGPLPEWMLLAGRRTPEFFDVGTQSSGGTRLLRDTSASSALGLTVPTPSTACPPFTLKAAEGSANTRYFTADSLRELVLEYEPHDKSKDQAGVRRPPAVLTHEQRVEREVFLDFLTGLLAIDPLKRRTPKQALCHPFLTGAPMPPGDVAFCISPDPEGYARKQATLMRCRVGVATGWQGSCSRRGGDPGRRCSAPSPLFFRGQGTPPGPVRLPPSPGPGPGNGWSPFQLERGTSGADGFAATCMVSPDAAIPGRATPTLADHRVDLDYDDAAAHRGWSPFPHLTDFALCASPPQWAQAPVWHKPAGIDSHIAHASGHDGSAYEHPTRVRVAAAQPAGEWQREPTHRVGGRPALSPSPSATPDHRDHHTRPWTPLLATYRDVAVPDIHHGVYTPASTGSGPRTPSRLPGSPGGVGAFHFIPQTPLALFEGPGSRAVTGSRRHSLAASPMPSPDGWRRAPEWHPNPSPHSAAPASASASGRGKSPFFPRGAAAMTSSFPPRHRTVQTPGSVMTAATPMTSPTGQTAAGLQMSELPPRRFSCHLPLAEPTAVPQQAREQVCCADSDAGRPFVPNSSGVSQAAGVICKPQTAPPVAPPKRQSWFRDRGWVVMPRTGTGSRIPNRDRIDPAGCDSDSGGESDLGVSCHDSCFASGSSAADSLPPHTGGTAVASIGGKAGNVLMSGPHSKQFAGVHPFAAITASPVQLPSRRLWDSKGLHASQPSSLW